MKLTEIKEKGLLAHYISTAQFKTLYLNVRFFDDLDEKRITARHLMLSMMRAKNKAHPTRQAVSRHLEELYDTLFAAQSMKLGRKHINQFALAFANPAFTGDETLFEAVVTFLKDTLYHPEFDKKTLDEEKRFLKDFFAAEYSNKTRYAAKRYIEHLYAGHPYKMNALGKKEDIDGVTLADIKKEHRIMIEENSAILSLCGDFDQDGAHALMKKHFSFADKKLPGDLFIRFDFPEKKTVTETLDVSQDRLFMTLKSDVFYKDDDYYAMAVFNAMFGESSESLLFDAIREKASLAYYVHATYAPFSGLITVSSAMEKRNVEKARALIRKTLEAVQAGDFTDEALELAKNHLITGTKQSYDNLGLLSLKALRNSLFDAPFKETTILDAIRAVSKDDVIRAARRLHLIFTYILGSDAHETD